MRHPEIGLVVLTHHTESRYARDLIAGGAQGRAYLLRDRVHDGTEFGAALKVVARGGSMIDPAVLRSLLAFELRSDDSPLSELTPGEHEVLAVMATGKSTRRSPPIWCSANAPSRSTSARSF